jgi:hypothetical protein
MLKRGWHLLLGLILEELTGNAKNFVDSVIHGSKLIDYL